MDVWAVMSIKGKLVRCSFSTGGGYLPPPLFMLQADIIWKKINKFIACLNKNMN